MPDTPGQASDKRHVVVAITGATGAIYGVQLLKALALQSDIVTHVVISDAGVLNLHQELDLKRKDVEVLADIVHNVRDVGASLASGSFKTFAMVVAPCSMRTLASIAHGLADNLITRCADVVLKERRRLVLLVRETPLNLAHLRNMVSVTEMGGVIFPPLPGFYHRPRTIEELVDHTIGRVLDLLDVPQSLSPRWPGMGGIEGPD